MIFNALNAPIDAPPQSLKDSNASLKVKTTEKKGVEVRSLARNISRVKGCVGTLGWGLGRVTSKSIIQTDLHKPNNKLVNAGLKHFWCMDKPHAYTDS
jgi:tRNA U55 pseudouridine synthase TruB